MEYRRLGSAGLQVSALSFGAWVSFSTQVGEDTAHDMMQAALDAGVNFFDNAEAYAGGKSEELMGQAIKKAGWKRNSLKIGEVVDVDGWLARDGTNHGNARRVTRKSTGEVLGAASSNSQTLAGNQGATSPAAAGAPADPVTAAPAR